MIWQTWNGILALAGVWIVGIVSGYLIGRLTPSGHQGAGRARRTSGSHAARTVTPDPLAYSEYYESTYDALTGSLPESSKRLIWDGFCARLAAIEMMWR